MNEQSVLKRYEISADEFSPCAGMPEPGKAAGKSVWLFGKNGGPASIKTELPPLPENCRGIRIEARFLDAPSPAAAADVFTTGIFQGETVSASAPVISFLSAAGAPRTVTLDSCALVVPGRPLTLTITRRTEDEGDTFQGKSALAGVTVAALRAPSPSSVVEDTPGYNSWPMCQTVGEKIVCAYCRGSLHDIFEPHRAVYARVSSDHGKSWEEENMVCNTPGRGDVPTGKGADEKGDMLLWVRHAGGDGFRHRLYRSHDGRKFTCIAEPELPLDLIQITDVFHIPGIGLTALFFGGAYRKGSLNYWGKMTSSDNGETWRETIIEQNVPIPQWPTEPSAVYLGEGKILVIARTESGEDSTARAQFQITSADCGKSWLKTRSNITDIRISTPSLIYDRETGLVSCYHFQRGKGVLNRRTADARYIFDSPLFWPAPETVAVGSCELCEAGNVNAVLSGQDHVLAYYSGKIPDTAIYVKTLPSPRLS